MVRPRARGREGDRLDAEGGAGGLYDDDRCSLAILLPPLPVSEYRRPSFPRPSARRRLPPLRDGLEHPQGVCSLRPPLMAIAETLHPPPADRRQVRGLEVARGDHMNIRFTSDHLCVPKT